MDYLQDDTLSTAILETMSLPVLALDSDLRVEFANEAFLTQFQVRQEETKGRLVYDLGNGQWDIPELRRLLGDILPRKSIVTDYRVDHVFEKIGRRIMRLNARRIARPDHPDLILLAISDDTEREALQAELSGRIEMADKLIDSVREGLIILEPDLRVRSASAAFYDTFGVPREETEGRLIYELGNGQWDIPELRQLLEDVLPLNSSFNDYEVRHTFKDIGRRVMKLNGRRLDHTDLILLAIRDVTNMLNSAARLKEVARAANVGVFDVDLRLGTVEWSPEMRDILGYPKDAAPPGAGVTPDFVHPEDRADVQRAYDGLMQEDSDGHIFLEHRIVRPDGEIRWVQLHGQTEFDVSRKPPRPSHMWGVILDVTEKKVAEAQLRERERNQSFLLNLSDMMRAEQDVGKIAQRAINMLSDHMQLDRCWIAVYHLDEDRAEIAYQTGNDQVPLLPDSLRLSDFPDTYSRVLRQTLVIEDDLERSGLSEAERQNSACLKIRSVLAATQREGEGTPLSSLVGATGIPRHWTKGDIALMEEASERVWAAMERAKSEIALRDSEARFRYIAEANLTGIGFGNSSGDIYYINDEMLRMMGRSRAEYEAGEVNWIDAISPEHSERLSLMLRDLNHDGIAGGFELEFLKPDGEKTSFIGASALISPERDTHVSLALDITDRKRAEERQNMLMAELDHRVKNILAVVQSITRQSLGRGKPVGPEAADRLVGRLNALAQSHALLSSSRWEGARLHDIIDSAVAAHSSEGTNRITFEGVDLKVSPKAAQSLNLALHELVTNAVKYGALSGEVGRVVVEWQVEDKDAQQHLVITWQEQDGPEITAPPTRSGFGSRLIQQALTAQFGGDVSMDFERGGLRAVIDLPCDDIVARQQNGTRPVRRSEGLTPTEGDPARLKGKKVLVVEDEYLIGAETSQSLQSAGCVVIGPVSSLPEAIRVAATDDIDLAVLDINLNDVFVWPAAHVLRARHIPVMFTTGYAETVTPPSELQDIVRIEKPMRRDKLLATLAGLLLSSDRP